MKRTHVSLTQDQLKELKSRSEESGMSKSEIIRRALDFYFHEKPRNSKGDLLDQT